MKPGRLSAWARPHLTVQLRHVRAGDHGSHDPAYMYTAPLLYAGRSAAE